MGKDEGMTQAKRDYEDTGCGQAGLIALRSKLSKYEHQARHLDGEESEEAQGFIAGYSRMLTLYNT